MAKKYDSEFEGQRDFYDSYLVLIDHALTIGDVLTENTDGVLQYRNSANAI